MIEGLRDAVGAAAPLTILEIEYNDPVLVLVGDAWSLALTCPWHLERTDGERVLDWEDAEVEGAAWDLIGTSIGRAEPHDFGVRPGTTFVLSNAQRLIIEPDTDLDPWALRVPSHVFVGP